jgi:hypothetical protein
MGETQDASAVYPYAFEFQHALMSMAVQDPGFLASFEDIIESKYFESPVLQTISKIVTTYFNTYAEPPSLQALYQLLHEKVSAMPANMQVQIQQFYQIAQSLYSTEVRDVQFIKDRAVKFAQRQAFKHALIHGVNILKRDGDIEEAQDLLDRSMTIGIRRDMGDDLYEVIERLPEKWAALMEGKGRIPTCLPLLNVATFGGVRKGELYIIQGIPKFGKSTTLISMGGYAVHCGYNVLHITIGDLKEFDVEMKYASYFAQQNIKEMVYGGDPYAFTRTKEACLKPNQLRIKYFSPYSLTVPQLRSYISWLRTNAGFYPDLLILDYPDKMYRKHEDSYSELGKIYMEIKNLLDDFKLACWAASQSNRSAASADVNRASNVAESWDKIANADAVIPASQTDQERLEGRARLYVEMVRFGQDHWTQPIHINYGLSTVSMVGALDAYKDLPAELQQKARELCSQHDIQRVETLSQAHREEAEVVKNLPPGVKKENGQYVYYQSDGQHYAKLVWTGQQWQQAS